jgi:hypothetical protein
MHRQRESRTEQILLLGLGQKSLFHFLILWERKSGVGEKISPKAARRSLPVITFHI